jgi:hypothetical protein
MILLSLLLMVILFSTTPFSIAQTFGVKEGDKFQWQYDNTNNDLPIPGFEKLSGIFEITIISVDNQSLHRHFLIKYDSGTKDSYN